MGEDHFDTLVIHMPTRASQQRCDPAIAVSAILPSELDHVGQQALFVRSSDRLLALRGSVLSQSAAGTALRDIQLGTNTINARAATSGA